MIVECTVAVTATATLNTVTAAVYECYWDELYCYVIVLQMG
jgi:hypothetical protein